MPGDPLALGDHVGVRPQDLELLLERALHPLAAYTHPGQRVRLVGGAVFDHHISRLVEVHIDDHTLGRRDHNVPHEPLVLNMAAVAADELRARGTATLKVRVFAVFVR